MSHPDPCYDPDNSYEDDMNYDDHNDFYGDYRDDLTHEELDTMWDEDSTHFHPDAAHEVSTHIDNDEDEDDDVWDDGYDDSMDGDFDSAMRDAGFGTDEDYGYYGEDY